jgi:hypothetical protein
MRKIIFSSSCIFYALNIFAQGDIYIASSGKLYTHPNSGIAFFGNIINDAAGGLNHNNGGDFYVYKNSGNSASRIYDGPNANTGNTNYNGNGSYIRIYNLHTNNSIASSTPSGTQINTTSGGGAIQIEQETRITGTHTFSNGMIWTPRGNWKHAFLLYEQGASYTGNSNGTHVDGYAGYLGSGNFDLPIGDGVYQRISGVVNASNGEYKAAYFNKNAQNGTAGLSGTSASTGPMNGGIIKVNSTEFWDIDGTASSQFKLTALNSISGYSDWGTSANFSGYPANQIVITGWDAWENLSINSFPSSLAQDGSFITSVATNPDAGSSFGTGNAFSAYTWAVSPTNVPLAITLADFIATEINCKASVRWEIENENGINYYELQQNSTGTFTSVATVPAKNNGNAQTYTTTVNQSNGLSLYRLKIVDITGAATYSSIISLQNDCNNSSEYISLYPVPATSNEITLSFSLNYRGLADANITNLLGQQIINNRITVNDGNNKLKINIAALAAGTYYLELVDKNGKQLSKTQKFIKQ